MESGDPVAIPAQPVRRMRMSPITAGVAAILVLVVSAGAAYFLSPPFRDSICEAIAAANVPADLRETIFVKTTAGERSVFYRAGRFGFVPVETPERSLSGTISPDGTMRVTSVTFVNGRYTNEAFGGSPIDADAWFISVHAADGREPEGIARGYAPAFLDGTRIAYFSKRGIVVYDMDTDRGSLVHLFEATTTVSHVQYSPDRTHVLWTDAASGRSVLAEISITDVKPVAVFTDLTSPVLRNSGVYELNFTSEGTEVRRYSLGGATAERVLTIPASLSILSMIP